MPTAKQLQKLVNLIEDALTLAQELADAAGDKFEALSEQQKDGERGGRVLALKDALEEAVGDLENVKGDLEAHAEAS